MASQFYHSISSQGGGKIAYVFFVSGYPWAVCTNRGLVEALTGSTASIKYVREKMFGKVTWDISGSPYCPAWDVPIFDTLMEIGPETWTADDTQGFVTGSGCQIKIQDRQLGYTWPHAADGDEIWGIEGLHRVARLFDSDVHGWGYLDEKLLTFDAAGDPPTTLTIIEESYSKLYSRIDGLGAGEWIPLWLEHECIAVSGIDSGSWDVTDPYSITIENSGSARGLYRSRPHRHLVGTDKDLTPIISDVPDSIAEHYCWIYGIPLSDTGELILDSDDNPIVAEEFAGIVSQDIKTQDNVTSIKLLSVENACKLDTETIEWVRKKEYDTHLAKYVVCRGENSGTTEATLVPYWQCPHLVILKWGWISFGMRGYDKIPIWLCGPGETRTFDSYEDIWAAVVDEVTKVLAGDTDQYTGNGATGFEYPTYLTYGSLVSSVPEGTSYTGNVGFIQYCLVSGPVAWVLGLGTPGVVGWGDMWPNIDPSFFDDIVADTQSGGGTPNLDKIRYGGTIQDGIYMRPGMFNLEMVRGKMDESSSPISNIADWLIVPLRVHMHGDVDVLWERTPGYMDAAFRSPYYYQWDWVNQPIDEFHDFLSNQQQYPSIDNVPGGGNTWYIPKSNGTRRLWLSSSTDEDSFVDTETVQFGEKFSVDRVPMLTGELDDDILEDSNSGDLYIEIVDDALTVDDTIPRFPGGSLFWLSPDPHTPIADPNMVKKPMSLASTSFSDVIRTMFGESWHGMDLAPELALDHVPFFSTTPVAGDYAEDFTSLIDWDSMDGFIHPLGPGHSYVLDTTRLKNIYDIIRNEVLLHGAAMTREWDPYLNMWQFRFRKIEPMNKTMAFQMGRVLTEDLLDPDNKYSSHNPSQLINDITVTTKNNVTFKLIGPRTRSIDSELKTLNITPGISRFTDEANVTYKSLSGGGGADITILEQEFPSGPAVYLRRRLEPVLRTMSVQRVANSTGLTRRGFYKAVLGRESLITDPAAHAPNTHKLGIENEYARIIKITRSLGDQTASISYELGGDAQYGFAPACRIESGNFTTHTTYWKGVPNDHDFSSSTQAKDMYYFDCYDLWDYANPQVRNCSCGDYAVHAIPEGEWNPTMLDFTCEIIDDGGTMKLKLTGADIASIDTGKTYIIFFQAFDSCEDCQKYYIFGADLGNTVGTEERPASRWVG